MIGPLRERARATLNRLRWELLDQRTLSGHWVGELSPSALSTATAISAMSAVLLYSSDPNPDAETLVDCVTRGIESLAKQQNPDGGFGDTDRSHSNIATSYLVLAASSLAEQGVGRSLALEQSEALRDYIRDVGEFTALRARYGEDKTFVVPILTNLAIAGLADWDQVPALPFEAAVFPQSMYRMLQMPVVSYAIPALVAIGQAQTLSRPSRGDATAMDSIRIDRSNDESIAANAAAERRLLGSDATDFVRCDELGGHQTK